MDERGVITAHGPFQGLDRFEARSAIAAALRAEGRIVSEKRPYMHAVGHCERCDTTVEPRLSKQWFVKIERLAKLAGDAVRNGDTKIYPPEMEKRYFQWVDNLLDWCISRQLWWGHRIPIWYGPDGEQVCVGPGEEAPPATPRIRTCWTPGSPRRCGPSRPSAGPPRRPRSRSSIRPRRSSPARTSSSSGWCG
ncbi:hypothetical protein GCM10029992_65530 [Glycomyces albus]